MVYQITPSTIPPFKISVLRAVQCGLDLVTDPVGFVVEMRRL